MRTTDAEVKTRPTLTLLKLIFRRRHDEAIRRTMPWLVASGAIVPGSIYRRK